MSAPSKTDLQGLDFSFGGKPFVAVAASAGETGDFASGGKPFVYARDGAPTPPAPTGAATVLVISAM